MEYVESIREDVRWLGFDWEDREYLRPTTSSNSMRGRCR
jgi:glutamyl/glutaminyl-tRNA synthetase